MFVHRSQSAHAQDGTRTPSSRVAVVGAGITGLGAALELSRTSDVVLFEREPRLGGHAWTREVDVAGRSVPVDVGFIVYNRRTYPLLTKLFDELGIATKPTRMSFSMTCEECGLSYAGGTLVQLAQSILRQPRVAREVLGILRFRRAGTRALRRGVTARQSLREWLVHARIPERTISHYVVPLTASVWSTAPGLALDMPAGTTLRFLQNHGLLSGPPPRWRTVVGGSRRYVEAVRTELERRGVRIHTGADVERIDRHDGRGASVVTRDGTTERFDAVLVATHAPQALGMLDEPTTLEAQVLAACETTANAVRLHRDASRLPRDRRLWAAWNYRLSDCAARTGPPMLDYHMGILQLGDAAATVVVSVNPDAGSIEPSLEDAVVGWSHPRFDARSAQALELVDELHHAGADTSTWFCGAWQGNGFHEDGLRAGYAAATHLTQTLANRVVPT